MPFMLVRNTVKDFDTWKRVFDEQAGASSAAGLSLVHLWQSMENPNEVFFLLRMDDVERGRAFVSQPEQAEIGRRAGVTGGEIWYVEDAG